MKYENKVVIVTGGGQGIGACISRQYAEEGAHVVIIDIDEEAGVENQDFIRDKKLSAKFYKGDVSSEDQVKGIYEKISKRYGKVDILINNAAQSSQGTLITRSVEEFQRIISVNLTGSYIMCKYTVPLMNNEGGTIINICSTRANMSEPHTEPYSASKGGLLSLTHSLAVSIGPKIRVNSISPGWIDVSGWKKAKNRKFTHLSEKEHAQHPAGRVGTPEDVARVCLFLTSKESDFITGTNIVIDGGMSIKMIYEG